jgi:carboxyl-terminal processing protease
VHGGRAVKYHSRVRSHVLPAVLALGVACAARSPAPAAVGPPSETPVMSAALTPPPLVLPAAERHVEPAHPHSARSALRRSIFEAAWTTVRDKHYDKTLGGVDWDKVRAKYEPLAVGAPDEPTFYRFVNEMLGTLGQSHLEVSGPGAEPIAVAEEPPPPPARPAGDPGQPVVASGDTGDPGLVVRVIEGKPTIASIRPGSSAARAGLRPGLVMTHVGGHPLGALPPSPRPLRPVEERFRLRLQAARRLSGPVGTQVTVRYLDTGDRPVEVLLARDPPAGRAVQIGLLPPLYPEVKVSHAGDIGIVAFNFFLLEPVLGQVQKAIDGLRAQGARALILDLRGNPGGVGAMAIPIAARLVARPLVLGTIQFRDYANTLTASPSLGVTPFTGRVVLLTDEGTASTSEILAAGLQEAGRALVVGDTTLGAVLPSAIAELPGGAVIQYVVADFRTPKGVLIEGRGVQPDRRVVETRAAIAAGRDAVLDAALVVARASARP